MIEILILARDYIERMANPVYGPAINEDYALRFADLLNTEGFEKRLNEEIPQLTDRNTLTSHGWVWLLGWAKSRHIDMSEELLIELFEQWSSVFVRTDIVDVATQNADYSAQQTPRYPATELRHSFLTQIISRATQSPASKPDSEMRSNDLRSGDFFEAKAEPPRFETSTALAESALIAFLQVGRPITLDAAAILLHKEWIGHERLVRFFWAICNRLEPGTQQAWIDRLHPPRKGRMQT